MRKIARSIITLVAGSAAIGFLAPSVATATQLEGYAGEVQRTAVAGLSPGGGITATAAERILRAQDAGARTVHTVAGRLGSRAAGGYLDAQGTPVVNVLDEAAATEA